MTVAHSKTLEDLYARTVLNEETGCLEWQGYIKPDGYGWVWSDGKNQYPHRLAFSLAHNIELSREDHICHECDNRACINVDHLFLGDAKINYEDAKAKDRHSYGEKHGNAVLTEDLVLEIRALANDGVSQAEISQQLGIKPPTVSAIVNRRNWGWLD